MSLMGVLQTGLGLYGALTGNSQANAYDSAAAANLQHRTALLDLMKGIAQNYDPHAETQAAVGYASDQAQRSLANALSGLNAQYMGAGGQPGGDTRFNVSAQGAADRIYDPLKAFAAQQAANETQRKLAAFQAAAGADNGSIANTYMNLANSTRTDPGGSLSILSSGLNKLFPTATPAAAANPYADPGLSIGQMIGKYTTNPTYFAPDPFSQMYNTGSKI